MADPMLIDILDCKICCSNAFHVGSIDQQRVCSDSDEFPMGASSYLVNYYQCTECGFLFTPDFDKFDAQDWLRVIYNQEYYDKVDIEYHDIRPRRQSVLLSCSLFFCKRWKFIDYGAGNGSMVNRLNMLGYNFTGWDPYGMQNSKISLPKDVDLITAFEVFEHHTNPLSMIKDMFSLTTLSNTILFIQTSLLPKNTSNPLSWNYVSPRNGHISIATKETMYKIAENLNVHYIGFGNTHLFSKSGFVRSYIILLSVVFCKLLNKVKS